VSDPYAQQYEYNEPATATANTINTGAWTKGEKQATQCRDPIFAVLLYINVIAMAVVAGHYGPGALKDANNNKGKTDYNGYIYLVIVTAVISFVFSGLAMVILMRIPEFLIKTSLIFVVAMSGVWAALAFAAGNVAGGIIGLIFFAISICYAFGKFFNLGTAQLISVPGLLNFSISLQLCGVVFRSLRLISSQVVPRSKTTVALPLWHTCSRFSPSVGRSCGKLLD
jgi:hypothetical protein